VECPQVRPDPAFGQLRPPRVRSSRVGVSSSPHRGCTSGCWTPCWERGWGWFHSACHDARGGLLGGGGVSSKNGWPRHSSCSTHMSPGDKKHLLQDRRVTRDRGCPVKPLLPQPGDAGASPGWWEAFGDQTLRPKPVSSQ